MRTIADVSTAFSIGDYADFTGYVLWSGVEGFVENASFSCTVVNLSHAFRPNIQEFVFHNGIWVDGEWNDGKFEDGEWRNGVWKHGIWMDGIWFNGDWRNGYWLGGKWCGGTWTTGYDFHRSIHKEPPYPVGEW